MSDLLTLEKHDDVAFIIINNPPANVWTYDSLHAFRDLVASLDQDPSNRAIVVTGNGEKFFSAGADLNCFVDGEVSTHQMAKAFGYAFEALNKYSGVTIAAINGYAVGGGLECALACDIRIAEEQAIMALPEAKIGLLPCGGGTQNLPWLVGEGWAKRMILCCEQVNAEIALRINLVDEVVPKGESLEKAIILAKQVKNQSPESVAACKQLIQHARGGQLKDGLPTEREEFVELFNSPNAAEGVSSFLEKRKAVWK